MNKEIEELITREPMKLPTTCGHCGRTWDDAVITAWTPTPSGRCPFEYDHEYDDDDYTKIAAWEAFGEDYGYQ